MSVNRKQKWNINQARENDLEMQDQTNKRLLQMQLKMRIQTGRQQFFWIWIEGIQIKRNKWTRYWEMNIIRLLSTLEHIESRVADIHLQCSLLLFLRMKLKFKKLKATKKNWWKVRQTHTRTHTHTPEKEFVRFFVKNSAFENNKISVNFF